MPNIKYKDDYNLAHNYLCGDREAGYALYANVFGFVKSFIYQKTMSDNLSDEDREDILSETLKTSIEILDRYTGTSKFSSFVIGIANNKIKEKIKSKKTHSDKEVEYLDEDYTNITNLYSMDPLMVLVDKENKAELECAINKLSVNHRQIIQFRMNGMTSKEISKLTGKSVDAIDSMYLRALNSLKRILKENNK